MIDFFLPDDGPVRVTGQKTGSVAVRRDTEGPGGYSHEIKEQAQNPGIGYKWDRTSIGKRDERDIFLSFNFIKA